MYLKYKARSSCWSPSNVLCNAMGKTGGVWFILDHYCKYSKHKRQRHLGNAVRDQSLNFLRSDCYECCSYVCTIQCMGYNFCCPCRTTMNYSKQGALVIMSTVIWVRKPWRVDGGSRFLWSVSTYTPKLCSIKSQTSIFTAAWEHKISENSKDIFQCLIQPSCSWGCVCVLGT
jgi:hypothetical protein